MANNQDYLLNLKFEKFQSFKLNSDLSKFDISQNMVIFFDLENNYNVNQYIKSQFEALHQKFYEVDKNFIYISNLDYPKTVEDLIKFYLPYLSKNDLQQFNFLNQSVLKTSNLLTEIFDKKPNKSFFQSQYQSLLDYIEYNGNIKSGFIFFDDNTSSIIECNDFILEDNPEIFFNHFVDLFKVAKENDGDFDSMIENTDVFDPYENLDDDAKDKIREIQVQLMELKKSGQLLFALPILKNILKSEASKVNLSNVSTILIDDEYRIILPSFNNLEIQLSHLTKTVYILFCKNPHGINIKELYNYRRELENLYSNISNQLDYDKMMQSIEDLVNPESKSIYTHISRIKAAFYKQMDYVYAKNFIVAGNTFGNDFKYISIIKPTSIVKSEVYAPFEGTFNPDDYED